jgi:hypothetical protein
MLHSIQKTHIHTLYTILQEQTSCLQIVNSDHVCILRIKVYGIPHCTYISLIFLMHIEIHEIIYANYDDMLPRYVTSKKSKPSRR